MNKLDWKRLGGKVDHEYSADVKGAGSFRVARPYAAARGWTIYRDGSTWTGSFQSASEAMRFVERHANDFERAK